MPRLRFWRDEPCDEPIACLVFRCRLMSRRLRALVFPLVLPVLLGCAATAPGPEAAAVAVVIVKPASMMDAGSVVREVRATLGGQAGVRYARPLAGDSHLVYLTAPATRERVAGLLEQLRASKAFQYVELDSRMKIQ